MTFRMTRDEKFIGKAFEELVPHSQMISHQSLYEGEDDENVGIKARSIFITAIQLYVIQDKLNDTDLERALKAETYSEVHQLVDEFRDKIDS